MLSDRLYQLCCVDPASVTYQIKARFPAKGLPAPAFTVSDSAGFNYSFTGDAEPNPSQDMLLLETAHQFTFPPTHVELRVQQSIPNNADSSNGYIDVQVGGPFTRIGLGTTIDGVDLRCLSTVEPPSFSLNTLDVWGRADQTACAEIVRRLYGSMTDALEYAQRIYQGCDQWASTPVGPVLSNGWIAARKGNVGCVWKTGTISNDQLLLQGGQLMVGPVSVGAFSTAPIWDASAEGIRQAFNAISPNAIDRLILCGHSLGGAAACVYAARAIGFNPDRELQLLTFGMPKPGDARLARILRPLIQCHVRTFWDPIPHTAPSENDIPLPIQVLIGPAIVRRLGQWRSVGRYLTFNDEGEQIDQGTVEADAVSIGDELEAYFSGGIVPLPAAHAMEEYCRILLLK